MGRVCVMLAVMVNEWHFGAAIAARHPDEPGYRIFVRDLVVAVSIGIYAHEKRQRARLRVTVDLMVATALPRNDDFSGVLDYETIVSRIKSVGGAAHINLVETFADRLAALCVADRRVRAVRVVVEKLDIYPEAESVGIVVERLGPAA